MGQVASGQYEAEVFSFAKFARHAFFTQVNRWLVEHLGIEEGWSVVDLACGPGAVTELILQLKKSGQGLIYAVDQSLTELNKARQRIASKLVQFVCGSAEQLSRLVSKVDAVVFCNAIHLIEDKRGVLEEIFKVLRPGGVLGFNTTFFHGAYPEGTASFYKLWVLRAMQRLRSQGVAVVRQAKATAMQWLSPQEFTSLLESVGFRNVQVFTMTVDLPIESLEDISEFSMFIEGALPGVPLPVASQALKEGVRAAARERGISSLPRNWLQVIARVPA